MNFRILVVTAAHAPMVAALIPPSVSLEIYSSPLLALRRACECHINGACDGVTIVATREDAAATGNFSAAYFVSPLDVHTFADLIPPKIWREEATKLLKLASHDYAMSAKYDKAHACAVLAGIKSPLVHELERIAELKQLEKQ